MKRKDETQTQFTIRVMKNNALQEAIDSLKKDHDEGDIITVGEVIAHIEKMQDWRE